MRKRLYDTGDFKIYYPDDMEEDEIDLYHSLVKFIAIGSFVCGIISLILFYIL